MWNFFERNYTPYNLRRGDLLLLPPAKSIRYGVNSLAFRGNLLWNNLPPQVKESQTVEEFKNRMYTNADLKISVYVRVHIKTIH